MKNDLDRNINSIVMCEQTCITNSYPDPLELHLKVALFENKKHSIKNGIALTGKQNLWRLYDLYEYGVFREQSVSLNLICSHWQQGNCLEQNTTRYRA